MELYQLQYFATTARTGSMLAAASECGVTQPTLSVQIKALEDELGVRLFDRHARGARLTAAGRRVLGSALRLMSEIEQLRREVRPEAAPHTQILRVGVQPALATEFTAQPFAQFLTGNPGWRLVVRESRADHLIEMLQSEHVDICIMSSPPRLPPGLISKQLFVARFAAYCQAGHPLGRKRKVHLSELLAFPLIVFNFPVQLGELLRAEADRRRNTSRVIMTCDQAATAFAMVTAGAGVAVLPAIFGGRCAASGVRQVMLSDPSLIGPVVLTWRKRFELPAGAERLLASIQSANPPL